MNILFVISSLEIGGEQRVASILTDQFIKMGHNVDLLTFCKPVKTFKFNSSIHMECYDKKLFKNVKRILKIRQKIKENSYDAAIGFAIIPSILCCFASIRTLTPAIICERNDPGIYSLSYKIIRRIAYKFASGAVFQTSDAQKYFCKAIQNKSTVIPNPIDTEKLPPPCVSKKRKRIVNTARLVSAKNHILLINAFEKIADFFPEYSLAIYGDGNEKESLNAYIKSSNHSYSIKIYEAREDILDIVVDDTLFVLSSNHEGYPNSLAEAMALGLPVISTDCRVGGPKEMIENGIDGILVKTKNVDELSEAMKTCLIKDEFRISLGLNAVKIRDKLDSKIIAKKWITYLSSVCK